MKVRDLLKRVPAVSATGAAVKATPAASPQTAVLLTPGRHVINGAAVDVPREGERDFVHYPLPPGRHVVDGKLAIVHPPGGIVLSFD